jgi:hypothetical protein
MTRKVFNFATGQTQTFELTAEEIAAAVAGAAAQAAYVPQSVTPLQARLALLGAGLLDQVEAAIAAGSRADQITWEFAPYVRRDYALIENLGTALGLTSAEIDDLFRAAVAL